VTSLGETVFDSCTHPTLSGDWIGGRRGLTFQELAALNREAHDYNALAIGLPGVGHYEHEAFKRECEIWGFEGIAAITTVEPGDLEVEFETIVRLGFRGIKVHPRLLGRNTNRNYLGRIFLLCARNSLVCLLCTYDADRPGCLPAQDPFYQLCDALNKVPHVSLILMHGGGSRLTQFAALARHSDTILLDLSFTIVDYMTRALAPSIKDLLLGLDRRLCIGSDSPEFTIADVIHKVRDIAGDLDPDKLNHVLSANLHRFFPGRNRR
jgi:predicted TIM-barrel fold metal-dependent hydrolase